MVGSRRPADSGTGEPIGFCIFKITQIKKGCQKFRLSAGFQQPREVSSGRQAYPASKRNTMGCFLYDFTLRPF
jgi:hypothetical protein